MKIEPPILPDRYRIQDVIDRGGMGAIWRVFDTQFGRSLAVKVMLSRTASQPELVTRFEREADITGYLQHPAIPPVIDRGHLGDGSPFFSMKLVEGETFAKLLKNRENFTEDIPKLLGIFEQACQAVGYAHSLGIIHRDLKPANVMVGAFGEVQVMDWGMAKRTTEKANDFDPEESTVQFLANVGGNYDSLSSDTDIAAEDVTVTQAGQVLGTLAYMPPEQARGEHSILDARADVFSLGGMLCKLLTGTAPYTGDGQMALFQDVRKGELSSAFESLDNCGADDELIALAKRCLSTNPDDRPTDASELAESLRAYDETTRQRLDDERRERAAAEAKAGEEGKRRKLLLVTAALLLVAVTAIGISGWLYQREQTARAIRESQDRLRIAGEVAEQRNRETAARGEIESALAQIPGLQERYQFEVADSLLDQATNRLQVIANPEELADELLQARRDLSIVSELDRIDMQRWSVQESSPNTVFGIGNEGAYNEAFRTYGIDLLDQDPESSVAKITSSSVSGELIAGLYGWVGIETGELKERIEAVLRLADDPARIRLYEAIDEVGESELSEMLNEINLADTPARYLVLIAGQLAKQNRQRKLQAWDLLKRAADFNPSSAHLHLFLASHEFQGLIPPEACESYARTAVALRPDSPYPYDRLGLWVRKQKRYEESLALYERALELGGDSLAFLQNNYGVTLKTMGEFEAAERAYRKALAIDPQYVLAISNLASLRNAQERYLEAVAFAEQAIEVDDEHLLSYGNLGQSYRELKRYADAEEVLKKSLALDAEYTYGLRQLGFVYEDQARWQDAERMFRKAAEFEEADVTFIARVYRKQERFDDAKALLEKRIESVPEDVFALLNLGQVYSDQRLYKDAVRVLEKAVAFEPENASAHSDLGWMFAFLKESDKAIATLQTAVDLDPRSSNAFFRLAYCYQKEYPEKALKAYERAYELQPSRNAHLNMTNLYVRLGRDEEAVQSLNKLIESDPDFELAAGPFSALYAPRTCHASGTN